MDIFLAMKKQLLQIKLVFLIALNISIPKIVAQDTLHYFLNLNYQVDLSDTFGGGEVLSADLGLSKSWYGVFLSFGVFQSHATYNIDIQIYDNEPSFKVPFDELTILKSSSLSGIIVPIQANRFHMDLVLGLTYAKSKGLCFRSLTYVYSYEDQVLKSLEKDYYFIEKKHFGYQAGLNISYYFVKNIGLQLSTRIQDLNNGGTFFLVGGGLSIKLKKN